jgi:hypothetical protein
MSPFVQAFLPNLVATILGVVLGLPAALYVNRRLLAFQRDHERAIELRQRDAAIDVLLGAFEYNKKVLERMKELAVEARVMRNVDLQVTAWEVAGPVLSSRCDNPRLLQQLGHHWTRLQRLEVLNAIVFDRTVGLAPTFADPEMIRGMWTELYDCTCTLEDHAAQLCAQLQSIKADQTAPAVLRHFTRTALEGGYPSSA